MRNRVVITLALALVSGGLAAYLAFTYLRAPEDGEEEATAAPNEVVVAARDMDVGEVVTEEDARIVRFPPGAVPAGYSQSLSEVVGRGVITPVRANEPLLSSKLARAEAGGGLSIVIPEGHRAMSVSVNEVIGVAGFVLPGTRVDVLVTAEPPGRGRGEDPVTQIALQDVEVVSAGQTIERNVGGEPQTVSVVTLLVTPDEAETLTLAADRGRLQLALRNPLDRDTIETEGMVVSNLLPVWRERRAQPRPRPRAPRGRQIEIYRGPDRSTTTVTPGQGGGE